MLQEKTASPPFAFWLALAAGVAFAIGLASVFIGGPPPEDKSAAPAEAQAPLTAVPENQVSLLILGVDDLTAAQPQLEAVWVATYKPPGRDLFLFGLPTDYHAPGQEGDLRSLFQWVPEDSLPPAFHESLREALPLDYQVVIVLDRVAFAGLVDFLGGVAYQGAELDGQETVAALDLMVHGPEAALQAQQELIQALLTKAAGLDPTPELTPLTRYLPDHAYLSAPSAQVVALVTPLLPLDPARVHVTALGGE